jgi:hypothetical protein
VVSLPRFCHLRRFVCIIYSAPPHATNLNTISCVYVLWAALHQQVFKKLAPQVNCYTNYEAIIILKNLYFIISLFWIIYFWGKICVSELKFYNLIFCEVIFALYTLNWTDKLKLLLQCTTMDYGFMVNCRVMSSGKLHKLVWIKERHFEIGNIIFEIFIFKFELCFSPTMKSWFNSKFYIGIIKY